MEKRRRKGHRRQNQLPSGRYRVQVVYKGDDGRRHTKSFTADTRSEAEELAEDFRRGREKIGDTIGELVAAYLNAREGVLSPSTMRGYQTIKRTYFAAGFGGKRLSDVSNADVQRWLSDISGKVSPKTVRNIYGLFRAAVDMFAPETVFRVQLPQKKRPELYTPSDADIARLLQGIDDRELRVGIMLAAFCTLRRGEICALTGADIREGSVIVSKSRVRDDDGVWHTKQPKTDSSYRSVPVPEFLLQEIDALDRADDERIIQCSPEGLSKRFTKAVAAAGLPHIRFHDLRHYSASILHAIGVPDQYILARGGWASDYVMKSVYRNAITDEARKQDERIADHFAKLKPCN